MISPRDSGASRELLAPAASSDDKCGCLAPGGPDVLGADGELPYTHTTVGSEISIMRTVTGVLGICGALLLGCMATAGAQATPKKMRVGIYDNRAVAVAYAASRHNPVREKMAEHEQAKAAGDTRRVRELEQWGEAHQRALHRQGFGLVPVDDLLANVGSLLPQAAAEAGVDVIVFRCNYSSPQVEIVDVTDQLVALFEPSAKTLATVAELREQAPIDLDEIERNED